MNFLKSPPGFAISYILLLIPTYYLPFLGSNSSIGQSVGVAGSAATGDGNPMSVLWLIHLACLILLIVISFIRGSVDSRKWISVFPSIALIFDMVPGLNLIPFIPTVMHICAIITGVKGTTKVAIVENSSELG